MMMVCRGVASGAPHGHLARGAPPKMADRSKKMDGHRFNPRLGTVLGGRLGTVLGGAPTGTQAQPKRPRWATDGMTTACRGVASGAPDGHFARGTPPKVAGGSKKMDGHGFNPRLGTVLGGGLVTVLGGAPTGTRARPKRPRGGRRME